MQTTLTASNRTSKFCHALASAATTLCFLLPAPFAHADTPVNSNILIMLDDSFSMNSEVQWKPAATAANAAWVEFTDLSKVGSQMFLNPRASQSANVGYTKGAGFEALYAGYNTLAFDPTYDYQPWDGIDPTTGEAYANRKFVCTDRVTADDASNTANENKYCPKYFPEFDNTLTGANCSTLNGATPSASKDTNYCVLRDCMQGGGYSGLHGCKEFVPLSDTTSYVELGQPWDQDLTQCVYNYPWKQVSPFSKNCLSYEAWVHFYPAANGNTTLNSNGSCATCTLADVSTCHQNTLTGTFCSAVTALSFPAADPITGTLNTAYNPFSYTCDNLNSMGQAHCQIGTGTTTRKYTNILRKYDLVEHRYTELVSGSLVSRVVAQQTAAIQQRYANWFTYYRTRAHVAKAALLKFTKDMGAGSFNERVGLGTNQWISYNPNTQWIGSSNTAGIISNIASTSNALNKSNLQTNIARSSTPFVTNGATPTTENRILTGIDEAGKYFSENDVTTKANIKYQYDNFAAAPTLDENDLSKNCRQNHVVIVTTNRWNQATTPAAAAGGAGKPTAYNSAANAGNNYYAGDFFAELNDKVPTNGYSANPAQHMKTWIAYFGSNGTIPIWDASSPAHVAPGSLSSTNDYIDDLANAAFQGKGGFYKATDVQSFLSIFDNDSGTDLLDKIRATNAANLNDCGNPGKRISWRELTKDK